MKNIVITRTCAGLWMYTVYVDGRAVVVGMSPSRQTAEVQARLV